MKPKLSYYFSKQKFITLWIIVFGILTNVLIIWIPTFQGRLIDTVLNGITGKQVLRQIMIYICLVAAVQFFRFFKRYLVRKFENRTVMEMRETIYNNIINSSIEKVELETVGSLTNKIIGDINIVSEGLRKIITEIFDTGIMLIGYIIIMIFNDLRLTILSCLFIPIAVILSKFLKTIVALYNNEYREAKGRINDAIYQNITHAILFRIYGLQDDFGESFKKNLSDIRKKAVKASFFDTSLEPIYYMISIMGIVFCIYYGSNNIRDGIWSVGQFSSFLVMYTAVAKKSGKISTYINLWQKTAVSWGRLKDQLVEEKQEKQSAPQVINPVILRFEDVSFSYNTKTLINNLSFEANTGEIVGICGPVASGKSTLLKLMTTETGYTGEITINNIDLRKFDISQKSDFISIKNHDPELFSGSFVENIAFDINEDISSVLNDSCLMEDLSSMSDGINTVIGSRGTTLSGGQKDRISLARTLFNHKSIILLDDPFSAIDMNTEKKVIQSLIENYCDSIIIITSHRFNVFTYVNKIICLDGKGGYEIGTHRELMETNHLYRQIYNMQKVAV